MYIDSKLFTTALLAIHKMTQQLLHHPLLHL